MQENELRELLEKTAAIIRDLVARNDELEKRAATNEAEQVAEQLCAHGLLDPDDKQRKVAELAEDDQEMVVTAKALDILKRTSDSGLSLVGNGNEGGAARHPFESHLLRRG